MKEEGKKKRKNWRSKIWADEEPKKKKRNAETWTQWKKKEKKERKNWRPKIRGDEEPKKKKGRTNWPNTREGKKVENEGKKSQKV